MARIFTDYFEPPYRKCECGDTGKVNCKKSPAGCDECIVENDGNVPCDKDERVPCPECA